MPNALWVLISVGLATGAAQREQPDVHFELDLTVESLVSRTVIVVPTMPRATHRRLVDALRKELGEGTIVPADRIQAAVKTLDLDAQKLRTVPGMTALARDLGAARLVVFEAGGRDVAVHVFNSEGLALRTVTLKGVRRFTSARDARRAAALFGKQAEAALSDPPPPPPEPEPETFPVVELTPAPQGIDPTDDIALEVQRDARRRADADVSGSVPGRKHPVAQLALGAAAGLRQLSASGSDAEALLPLQSGALPAFAVHAVIQPLQLSPAADASWSGIQLEGRFRRTLAHARRLSSEDERCSVVDQDWLARAGWQSRPEDASGLRLGGGGGFGSEEVRYGCALPTVSSRYRFAEVHARAAQPLLEGRLLLELILAPRLVFRGPGVESTGFSWAAEGWITGALTRWSFVRGGARVHQTRVERNDALALVDSRQFFAFEVGVQIP